MQNINKQKEKSRYTYLRLEIIKEEIEKLDHLLLEAFRKTKPIDYKNKLIKLNNTINNLQSSVDALRFNQLPSIQSKKIHEGITKTVSDPLITK